MKSKLITSSVFASILAMSALFAYSPAQAQWHHHGGHYRGGYYGGGNWVAPALIGGVIGYELSRPRYYEPPVVVQQPVIVQQQPVYSVTTTATCTVWTETQHADGTITRTRTCTQ
jgi:hypothetical protein